jgi:hypothetical protein
VNELVRALNRFVGRDLVYVVAGAAVVLTFLYVFGRLPKSGSEWPTAVYFLAAGIGYIVAYTIQDGCSVLRLVSTAPPYTAWSPLRWMYRRFTREIWEDIPLGFTFDRAAANIPERQTVEFGRNIMLMQIGTTGGPCGLLCAGLLAWKVSHGPDHGDVPLFAGVLVLSLLLIALGWLKVAQLGQLLRRLG